MAAVSRLGLYGGPRSPYGSFAGKADGGGIVYTKTYTRQGLYGGPRILYGDFSAKSTLNPAVALETTVTGEVSIVAGGQTITLTLTDDTWVAAGATFNAQRQNIIDGLTSAQSETLGWNNEVRDKEVVTSVSRSSDTIVIITLTASEDYQIVANETVTATIPAGALVTSVTPLVASPVITVTYDSGIAITNSGATTDVPNNYEQCDITGFRVHPDDGLHEDGYGQMVRRKSLETRHPQDGLRSTSDKQRGSVSPEGQDRFVGTDIDTVTAEDL